MDVTQASNSHGNTASHDFKLMPQQEIAIVGDHSLGIPGGDVQSPTAKEETVIQGGQVFGLTNDQETVIQGGQLFGLTNDQVSSQAVYTEYHARDLSTTSCTQISPTPMSSFTPQVNQCLSGDKGNSAAVKVDNMISEDKSLLVQHSVEDLVHAEILMSLKTGFTTGETEVSSGIGENSPDLISHETEKCCYKDLKRDSLADSSKSLDSKQSTDVEGVVVHEDDTNALQERRRKAMCRALEYVLADLKDIYESTQMIYPFRHVISGHSYNRDIYLASRSESELTKYKCGICGKKYGDQGRHCSHVNLPKTTFIYRCDVCGKEFQFSSSLRIHMKMHRLDDVGTRRFCSTVSGTVYNKYFSDMSRYECEVCGKRLRRSDELKVHLQLHQSRTCKICMKEFSNLSYHMRQHSEDKTYTCNICDKSFGYSGALTSHVKFHDKMSKIGHKLRKDSYKCVNYHFSSPQHTHISYRTYQNCFGRFQCLSCPKSFPSRHQLQAHAVYHSEPKFKCLVCHQVFYHKYQLQLHQISHTGFPRHMCRRCNRSFLFSFSLRMHMRIHTSLRLLHRMVKPNI